MTQNITTVTREIAGREMTITTGHVARQAHGAVTIQCGGTVVLATAVCGYEEKEALDFLPLTVEYRERTYAAGKIPGGFFKRGGRPGEKEILTARLIDRSLRPQIPKGINTELQINALVISSDMQNNSDIPALIASSAALGISDIPFSNLIGAVRIGRIQNEFVVNPTFDQIQNCDLDIVVAGTRDNIVMVEGEAEQIGEDIFLAALTKAQEIIRDIVGLQEELTAKINRAKRALRPLVIPAELDAMVKNRIGQRMADAVHTEEKQARAQKVADLKNQILSELKTEMGDEAYGAQEKLIKKILDDSEVSVVRLDISHHGRRPDGRQLKEIRPIQCEINVLPRPHGSALFTRGQTQALVVTTLGTKADEQLMEQLEREYKKNFMLFYNFPSFSVGEARTVRGPGRREIGHGMLAERALAPVIPDQDVFRYTIQVTSDILESNGSSSMASVCGASLSLMDAGVPITAPVAGIAMGLIKEGDTYTVLTDIQGLEDHFGDMDFKVAGTQKGITAIQMDIKITGLTHAIMQQALDQAKDARLHILGIMNSTISQPKSEVSEFAPRMETIEIDPDAIRTIIGPSGKMIKKITEETGTDIEIADDGKITIAAKDPSAMAAAKKWIYELAPKIEIGQVFEGTVKRIADFGAFVEIVPNKDGLVHISQLAEYRVNKVTDIVKEGDKLLVKVIDIDKDGKIRLSHKEAARDQETV